MLEKPDLADEAILDSLREHYGILAASVDFLPIGNDATAWVYRVNGDGDFYFLKLKKGAIYESSVMMPRYLRDSGIEQVVAPLPAHTEKLWVEVGNFNLILYPFIDGKVGMEVGLSDDQWKDLGKALKHIHTTQLPDELLRLVQKESFVPQWGKIVQALQAKIDQNTYADPYQKALAEFWREKHEEIGKIVDRANELGQLMQERSADLVLCHADIHTANILLTSDGKLWIVDWDGVILAPKERDLMFMLGDSVDDFGRESNSHEAFLRGYGKSQIDWLTLAYYRYEWVVQELGDFGERVFLTEDTGEETKQDAVNGFRQLFDPGDVVEVAYRAEQRWLSSRPAD